MRIQNQNPLHFFAPIVRYDDDKRIVVGRAFANEVVTGEGGIRLKSSAMENATADYMKYGTIRAMHQPVAAGTATPNDPEIAKECGVSWIDFDGKRVADISCYISDDTEWKKVKDGTYKGFSVGVAPKVMRGKTVESCTWFETSLVDRPKDPDALFTAFRVDGLGEILCEIHDDEEEEIERLEELERGRWTAEKRKELPVKDFGWPEKRKYPIDTQEDVDSAAKLIGKAPEDMRERIKTKIIAIAKRKGLTVPDAWETEETKRYLELTAVTRGMFAKVAESQLPGQLRYVAFDMLSNCIWMIQSAVFASDEERETALRMAVDEFADFLVPIVVMKSWPDPAIFADVEDIDVAPYDRAAVPMLTRMSEVRAERIANITRVEELETQVFALTAESDESITRIAEVQELERVAKGRIAELENMPTRPRPQVGQTQVIERTFGTNPDHSSEIKK